MGLHLTLVWKSTTIFNLVYLAMKKNILLVGFLAFAASFTIVSCSDDDGFGVEQTQNSVLILSFTGENIADYKTLNLEIKEINTGTVITKVVENASIFSLELPRGSYKIAVNGEVISHENETLQVAGTVNKDVISLTENEAIKLFPKQFSQDFIIEEVFFSGVQTPEGKAYNSSRYFKLINNTAKVLYADGLLIIQSEFLTSVNNSVTPYDTNQYFPTKGVMMLPGTGTEHAVQPGDFIVIADNAINHNALNSNAFNLSNANFEFPNTNPALGNVDNPNVPNAEVLFTTYTFNMFLMNNSGVEAYGLARFPAGVDKESFIANNRYTYSYTNASGNITTKNVLKIPNTWIVDAQNNGSSDKFLQLLTSSSIDAGYTGVGSSYQNSDRYGKSVRRKVLGQSTEGKNVYKDTNDSSVDFIRNSVPSLKNGIVH